MILHRLETMAKLDAKMLQNIVEYESLKECFQNTIKTDQKLYFEIIPSENYSPSERLQNLILFK